MPVYKLLILLVVVIAAAGLTVAAIQGLGFWIVIPVMIAGLGLRVWMAR